MEPVAEFKTILQLAKNLTIQNNAKLYFVYLPEVSRYKDDSFKSKYNKVKQIVDDLNITFLDMHSMVFEKEEDPLILFPFERRKHYTVEGYMKIAKEIYNSR